MAAHYALQTYGDILLDNLIPHRLTAPIAREATYSSLPGVRPVAVGEFTAFIPTITKSRVTASPMASGKKTYRGAIACPAWIDLGTKIEVEGIGIFVCEDRMAAEYRYRENFDILVTDYDNAVEFGRQHLRYRIVLEPLRLVGISFPLQLTAFSPIL